MKIRPLRSVRKIIQVSAEFLFGKCTISKVLVPITHQRQSAYPKTHQLQSEWIAVGGFFRKSVQQLVGYQKKHFTVGRLSG